MSGTGNATQSAALTVAVAPVANLAQGADIFGGKATITGTDGQATAGGAVTTLRAQINQGQSNGNNVRVQGSLNEASSGGVGLGASNQPAATGTTGLADYTGSGAAAADDYLVGVRGATFTSGQTTNALNVVGQTFSGSFNKAVGGYFLPSSGATNLGTVAQVGGTANQAWRETGLAGQSIAATAINYGAGAVATPASANLAMYSSGGVQMTNLGTTTATSLVGIDATGNLSTTAIPATVTAGNGLSRVGDSIVLGGTLSSNTTVAGGNNRLTYTSTSTANQAAGFNINATAGNAIPAGNEVFGSITSLTGSDGLPASTPGLETVLRASVNQATSTGPNADHTRVQGSLNQGTASGFGLGTNLNIEQAIGATGLAFYQGPAGPSQNDYIVGLLGTTISPSNPISAINVEASTAFGTYLRSIGGYFRPTGGTTGNLGVVSQIGGTKNSAWQNAALNNVNAAVVAVNTNTAGANERAIISNGAVQMTNLGTTTPTSLVGIDGAGNLSTTAIPAAVTASNGLNRDVNDIQLGGPLTEPTTVTTSNGNTLTVSGTGNATQSAALTVAVAPSANLAQGADIFGGKATITGTDGQATAGGAVTTLRAQINQGQSNGNNVRVQGSLNEASSGGVGLGASNQPAATGTTGLADYTGSGAAAADDYLVGVRGATFTSGQTTNALNVVGQTFTGSFARSIGGYFLPSNGATNLGTVTQVGGTANQAWREASLDGRNIAATAINYAAGAPATPASANLAVYSSGGVQMTNLGTTTATSLVGIDGAGNLSTTAIPAAVTASNGLNRDVNDIQLGGPLTEPTTITAGTNELSINGTTSDLNSQVVSFANTPAAGSLTGVGGVFTTEATQNYTAAGESAALGVFGNAGAVRGLTTSSSINYQAQGGNFEARVISDGATGGTTGVGSIGIGTATIAADNTFGNPTVVGVQGGTFIEAGADNWDAIGVEGFTDLNGGTGTGRTAGGVFEGLGGATQFGVVGAIDGTGNYRLTFNDPEFDGKRIGVVATNQFGFTPGEDYALYGKGAVALKGLNGAGDSLVTMDGAGNLGYTDALTDAQIADNLTVTGGTITATPIINSTINGSQIGASTPAAAAFTTLRIDNVQEFADNTAAMAGGLPNGSVYRTGDILKIVHP